MSLAREDRSYRALLGVPSLRRILVAMQLARIAGAMLIVALVLCSDHVRARRHLDVQ